MRAGKTPPHCKPAYTMNTMRTVMLSVALVAGCSPSAPPPPATSNAEKLKIAGIENVFRVTPNLYSGGSPDGDAAFAELKKLGIQTVISVDGMAPDIVAAERHSMKYVHLPMGYDGIRRDMAFQLAKAVQTLPGPVFIHCHHGKHRGPAALAAVRLCLEPDYTPAAASAWLQQAGTDPKYKGLYGLPTKFKRPAADELAAVPTAFPAKSPVPDLAARMVQVDEHWEAIRASQKKEWLGAESAATLLAEDFREAKRLPASGTKGDEFAVSLTEAEAAAKELAAAVKAEKFKDMPALMAKAQGLCAKCHARYRD
jgi:protein tyrosine phosphatase (PTP) superfamily phosphohydrolase (DUF442 family)